MNIHEAVNAMCSARAREQGIMTLGELRAALKMLPPETPIVTDNGSAPASLASYRGYYERLAIGTTRHRDDYETTFSRYAANKYDPDPAVSDVTIAEPVTAAEMLKALDLADGLDFGGYKGGTYWMDSGTWMHLAEYGDCGRAIVGVRLDGQRAIIESTEEEW